MNVISKEWTGPLCIVLGISALIAVALAPFGESPADGFATFLQGAFGSPQKICETLVKMCPLLFTGLAVALAFQTGAFNIGAEGQYVLGALGAVLVGSNLEGVPSWIAVPLVLAAAFIAGGIWGGLAGVLKGWRDVPEVISTIMLNFIALYWLSALIRGPLRNTVSGLPESGEIAASAELVRFVSGYRLHAGIPFGILFAALVYLLLSRTVAGYKMRAVGFNPDAAKFAGYRPGLIQASSLALSGALAGLGGGVQVAAITFNVTDNYGAGCGYTAIAVALMARLHPLAVILTAFFFGALEQGAGALQRSLGVPLAMVYIVQALVILLTLVLGFHRPGERISEAETA